MTAWVPFLDGELAHRASAVVDAIAARLRARAMADDDMVCDLMRGDIGIAVFLAYYARARDDQEAATRAAEIIERAIEIVPTITERPQLFGGFAGPAWVVEHLRSMFDVDSTLNDAVDQALVTILEARPDWLCAELLFGVAGWGVYALERRPFGGPLLERVVEELDRQAVCDADGVRWRCPDWLPLTKNLARFPDGCFPLDPAHGTLGPLGVLGGAAAAGVTVSRARSLLTDAIRWLAAQRLTDRSTWIYPCYPGESDGGIAWCNGDPGIAGVLSAVASATNESTWETLALEAASRLPLAIRQPMEGGLCHGLAGAAHILLRVIRRSHEPSLEAATREAFRDVIGSELMEDPSLLTGAAGVGLALLAATTSIEPEWDRVLLLSFR